MAKLKSDLQLTASGWHRLEQHASYGVVSPIAAYLETAVALVDIQPQCGENAGTVAIDNLIYPVGHTACRVASKSSLADRTGKSIKMFDNRKKLLAAVTYHLQYSRWFHLMKWFAVRRDRVKCFVLDAGRDRYDETPLFIKSTGGSAVERILANKPGTLSLSLQKDQSYAQLAVWSPLKSEKAATNGVASKVFASELLQLMLLEITACKFFLFVWSSPRICNSLRRILQNASCKVCCSIQPSPRYPSYSN